ncbi:MAG: N-6 DNA methylase [Elusimicrobia bacterium]|nr:N-6 DNA methylase [Elusimicrobiota bacterium]
MNENNFNYSELDSELVQIKDNKVTYLAINKSYRATDPEEQVRISIYQELIKKYKYPKEKIDLEVIVPRRKPEDKADIIVYEDDEKKNPYLVVECKKDGITDAEYKQAIEQVFGNANSIRAKFACVVAGNTRTVFDVSEFKPSEREKNVVADIPIKYGKVPKYKFLKGDKNHELIKVSKDDLMRALGKAHDTIWQGGKYDPTDSFDEISKLLFCKLSDEKEETIKGDPYKFQIGTHETADEVFKRIDSIYQKAKKKASEVFQENIKLDSEIVYSVVEHLQSINFNKTDLDTKGIAFETFLGNYFKGEMGRYFTPREVIRFSIKMLNPKTDQLILDPACGSGGFLLNAMDFIREYAQKEFSDDPIESYRMWHDFAKENLYGIEISDKIARVCKMNMIIHDDGHTNIISTDSLSDFEDIQKIRQNFKKNKFDLILTNPPFGANVKGKEKPYLEKYELGKNKKNQSTEVLFIERCLDFLKEDGKMAIVLPDGILTNSSLQPVRDFLMKKSQILAVVSLPQFAFAHFGAGVKTSLVFLRKKDESEKLEKYPIFMSIAEHIGYDATGRKDTINDLDTIYEEYKKFSKNPKEYKGI